MHIYGRSQTERSSAYPGAARTLRKPSRRRLAAISVKMNNTTTVGPFGSRLAGPGIWVESMERLAPLNTTTTASSAFLAW